MSVSPVSLPRDILREAFVSANTNGRPAFVAFLTAGFPVADSTVPIMLALQANGADIIELGVPFSDSTADGPTIQKANNVAIASGTNSLSQTLLLLQKARAAGVTVPVVLMSSFNPLLAYNSDYMTTIEDCKAAGAHGFIISDLPPEEGNEFREVLTTCGMGFIPLLAPTSSPSRVAEVVKSADSWIYAVSVLGVTGVRSGPSAFDSALPALIANIRKHSSLPVAIGFGVSTNDQFKELASSEMAPEGVIVGSAILNAVSNAGSDVNAQASAVASYCKSLLQGATHVPSASNLVSDTGSLEVKEQSSSGSGIDDMPVALATSHFGAFGGMYVPETLMGALRELSTEFEAIKRDPSFAEEFRSYYPYLGRPSNLHRAERLTAACGGASIWLKREDLNHTGSHKITNALGQVLMARRLGKTRIIAETGAGQHGVATATICAKFGLDLVVYMGAEDVRRQALNVFRMELLGAKVVSVTSGSMTLKDAVNEAMRDWVANIRNTHYVVGSAIGPHPFPAIVKHFQSVISQESKAQLADRASVLPSAIVACVGGGSNAIGSFAEYMNEKSVRLVGVEAGGDGPETDRHSATLCKGTPGVLHGTRTILLQDKEGQIVETHSISAGLDYPGVGPEHAFLMNSGRAEYVAVNDREALEGFLALSRLEGIIPALETSHAVFYTILLAKELPQDQHIILTVSGRGDKDVNTVTEQLPKFFPDGIPSILAGLDVTKQY